MKPDPLVCQLCSTDSFTEVRLPGGAGQPSIASGLVVCRGCRTVYHPQPPAPGQQAVRWQPPDLSKSWGGSSR